jgi:hypothetical protein
MQKKIHIIGVVLVLLAVGLSGCEETEENIVGTGEIQFVDLEGGFYGIVSNENESYDPINLPTEFKENGLQVNYTLKVLKDQVSVHMWGSVVEIIEIEKLGSIEDNHIIGNLVNYSSCKEFFTNYQSSEDCIEYEYDGENILLLTHINAAFNCCPEIAVNISISNDTIQIEEIEISGSCNCVCLYDLNYEIKELKPGNYTIKVIESDIPLGEEMLEFKVDLSSATSGSYCVDRNQYPWV